MAAMDLRQWADRQLDVPTREQERSGTCGPACLRMAALSFGLDVPEAALAAAGGTTEESGTGLQGMVAAAAAIGLEAVVQENATLEDLGRSMADGWVPIVTWWSYNEGHYSVVTGLDAGQIILNDPETGTERRMPEAEFVPLWFDYEAAPGGQRRVEHTFIAVRPAQP